MKRIVAVFDDPSYSDSNQESNKVVVDLMSEVRRIHPPISKNRTECSQPRSRRCNRMVHLLQRSWGICLQDLTVQASLASIPTTRTAQSHELTRLPSNNRYRSTNSTCGNLEPGTVLYIIYLLKCFLMPRESGVVPGGSERLSHQLTDHTTTRDEKRLYTAPDIQYNNYEATRIRAVNNQSENRVLEELESKRDNELSDRKERKTANTEKAESK